jgi:hypothetical protein
MTSVELNAYRLVLRNGTLAQVRQALEDINELEPTIPKELLADIIETLRMRGKEASLELSRPIHKLLGKTHSMELFLVADEYGHLELDRAPNTVYLSGKVNLFVNQLFYHPEVELMVIDELYQWVNYVEQTVRQKYPGAFPFGFLEAPEYDKRLKSSELFSSPLFPIGRILRALDKIASPEGRETMLALEYYFRPRVNDCLVIEMTRAARRSMSAIKLPEQTPVEGSIAVLVDILAAGIDIPTVFHLKAILDRIGEIARTADSSEASDPISGREAI